MALENIKPKKIQKGIFNLDFRGGVKIKYDMKWGKKEIQNFKDTNLFLILFHQNSLRAIVLKKEYLSHSNQ